VHLALVNELQLGDHPLILGRAFGDGRPERFFIRIARHEQTGLRVSPLPKDLDEPGHIFVWPDAPEEEGQSVTFRQADLPPSLVLQHRVGVCGTVVAVHNGIRKGAQRRKPGEDLLPGRFAQADNAVDHREEQKPKDGLQCGMIGFVGT
jgi:hypothetical protein